ncbi:MAG: hypothetical protein JSW14_00005, partial [Candidatus Bathyarchaeum sp.]
MNSVVSAAEGDPKLKHKKVKKKNGKGEEKKMRILKNKKVSRVALVLVITIVALLLACLPVAIAQVSSWDPAYADALFEIPSIPTSAYLSVTPNPVVVNQEVSMNMWLNVTPSSPLSTYEVE